MKLESAHLMFFVDDDSWYNLPFFPVKPGYAAEIKIVEQVNHIFSTDLSRYGSFYCKRGDRLYVRLEREIAIPNGTLFPDSKMQRLVIPKNGDTNGVDIDKVAKSKLEKLESWRKWFIREGSAWCAPTDSKIYELLFYHWKKVALPDGDEVPLLAIGLLKKPTSQYAFWWPIERRSEYEGYEKDIAEADKEVADVKLLAKDLEEFPIEVFYDALNNLDKIRIIPDRSEKGVTRARQEERDIVVTIQDLKRHLSFEDLVEDYFLRLLIHEFYHHVEWKLEDKIPNLFNGHGRWEVYKGDRKRFKCESISYVSWCDEEFYYPNADWGQLAELLTALTIAKHPEIKRELSPQMDYLRELAEDQGYLFKSNRWRSNGASH